VTTHGVAAGTSQLLIRTLYRGTLSSRLGLSYYWGIPDWNELIASYANHLLPGSGMNDYAPLNFLDFAPPDTMACGLFTIVWGVRYHISTWITRFLPYMYY
jgi:hypothetical protein